MSGGVGYGVGKAWVRLSIIGKVAAVLVTGLVAFFTLGLGASYWVSGTAAPPATSPTAYGFTSTVPTDPERVAAGRKALVDKCASEAAEMQAQYKRLFAGKNFLGAKEALGPCPRIMDDPKLAKQAADAQAAHQVAVDAAAKKVAAAEKAAKKKAGVSIGMTEADVLASSWGKPEKINRSTNKYGTREQWVYGGGNYLYLEDGKVSAIQN